MRTLTLSNDLDLPIQSSTQKFAWIGTTGSGKTYGASKLAEQLWHEHAQFIVLDPVGVWYGLRLERDGKKPSVMDIPIFGGLHGDVPLEATGGALIADLVVDRGESVILDVSQFEHETDKARFAKGFADRFFFRKKAAPSAVHLFLEECQEFVPQNPQRGEEGMLHAFTRMQKLGRNFGIGSSYITQRPQEVNKKALNLAQTLFVFRTTGPHERKSIEGWMEDKGLDQDIAGDLPKLATGTCHVWSPEFLKVSKTVVIKEKETFNASATPEVGKTGKARDLEPIDLDEIREAMAATIERAKADDPKELRRQLSIATAKLRVLEAPKPTTAALVKPVLKDGQLKRIEGISTMAKQRIESLDKITKDLQSGLSILATQLHLINIALPAVTRPVNPHTMALKPIVKMDATQYELGKRLGDENGPAHIPLHTHVVTIEDMPKIVRTFLTVLAQHPAGLTKGQILVHADYRASGTSSKTFAYLVTQGFVSMGGGKMMATSKGLAALGAYEPLPVGHALLTFLLTGSKLNTMEKALLDQIAQAYPITIAKGEVLKAAGYAASGSSSKAFAKLVACQYVRAAGSSLLRLSDDLT